MVVRGVGSKNVPAVLLILDGWGHRRSSEKNAVRLAKTPCLDRLWKKYPSTLLSASGPAVGLPKGVMGNSEVGHMTIGAGRIIDSPYVRVNNAISSGSFFSNKELVRVINGCKNEGGALHLVGMLSDKGVHSHEKHLYALLELIGKKKFSGKVYLHIISDGRDTEPCCVKKYLGRLLKFVKGKEFLKFNVVIASVCGRYYAMDRDERWNRTKKAYDLIAFGNRNGKMKRGVFDDVFLGVRGAYARGETDEFILPLVHSSYEGVGGGDGMIFFNFREDRMRQLVRSFVDRRFGYFDRGRRKKVSVVCMTEYDKKINAPVAFLSEGVSFCLGEVLSKKKVVQLRCAETEKYAHVTYFFNGGREKAFVGERRVLVHSPKVATYDKKPEMSVFGVTEKVVAFLRLKRGEGGVAVVNFANGDMVGHTGNLKAAVKACEAIDACVGKLVEAVEQVGGVLLITADHGNCEDMRKGHVKAHTTDKVPLIVVGKKLVGEKLKRGGGLSDVAPTLLGLLGIRKPKEMKGKDLLV